MPRLRQFFERCWHHLQKRSREAEMKEELELHLAHRVEGFVSAGLSEKEARLAALKQFGGLEQVKEQCREQRRWVFLDRLFADAIYSLRRARKAPAFTAIAIATLALCLSANLVILCVVDSVLIRPLPFADEDRLVTLYDSYSKAGLERNGSSLTSYYERRGNIPAFASLSAYRFDQANVGESGATERVNILRVSPEFFATLGVTLAAGRAFEEKETTHETDDVVIITESYSRAHFGGSPNAMGKDVRIDGSPKRIVGVLPAGFRFLSYRTELFLPLSSNALERGISMRHHSGGIETLARLNPKATLEEAQMEIRAHYLAHASEYPYPDVVSQMGFHTVVVALRADYVAALRPILLLIQTGGVCLLLIGSVNFINLLLIRASSRMKELAVCQALGAKPWMIVGDAMVDTTLLAGLAGLIAVGVAAGAIKSILHFASNGLPLHAEIGFNPQLAAFTFLAALALGIALAIPIAYFNLHANTAKALQSKSRGGGASGLVQRLRYVSIVTQIALAFTLISSAGQLSLSLARAAKTAPGFSGEKVLTAEIDLVGIQYNEPKNRSAFVNRLREKMTFQTGVVAAAISNNVPMSGKKSYNRIAIDGVQIQSDVAGVLHYTYFISGEYIQAMGIPLKEGRLLESQRTDRDLFSCIVDENFANRYWPGSSALGHKVYYGPEIVKDEGFTIVGVVGAVKQTSLTDDRNNGAVYFNFDTLSERSIYVVIRSSMPTNQLGVSLTKWVRAADPEIPVADVRTMETRLADSVGARRWPALLTSVFAALGLLLTSIGTYGVVSYAVNQRRREIGIRLALGAQPSQVQVQMIKLGLKLLVAGTIVGVIGAALVGKAIQNLLFNVPVFDVTTLLTTGFMMTALLLSACWWPARRAALIHPIEVLAEE